MYDHTFYKLANHEIDHQATHKVCCQPSDFLHFSLPLGFVWVCIGLSGWFVNVYYFFAKSSHIGGEAKF